MKILEKLIVGIGVGVFMILIIAIVGVIGAIPVYFLWNWLMPEIFGFKLITFWQAWGLILLSGTLFKDSSSSKSSN